ncbi:MAG: hypothetical protein Q7T09_01430 [Phenylobacterium sp.]|nr:hypothetical protein [Phenylobacterium sp.]
MTARDAQHAGIHGGGFALKNGLGESTGGGFAQPGGALVIGGRAGHAADQIGRAEAQADA